MAGRAVTVGRRRAARWRGRLRRAWPSRPEALAGSALWAAAMACSAAFSTRQSGWSSPASIVTVATVFAVGALPAWPVAAVATALLASGREPAARFACAFLTLAAVTVAATAALYALWYRDYYADWHAAALSVEWMFQFAFTTAGAVFQFLVLGLRMYLPLGLVALFVAAMHLSRHAR